MQTNSLFVFGKASVVKISSIVEWLYDFLYFSRRVINGEMLNVILNYIADCHIFSVGDYHVFDLSDRAVHNYGLKVRL